jgi:DNA invertase Pin-like site-specific DNA recombinase
MRYKIYLRVSTDEQADSKAGLNAQLDACQEYRKKNSGLDDLKIFSDEGLSGSSGLDKRPGLLDAINCLGKGDVLLVAKRDRLGRDPILVAMIESAVARKGARVISAAGEGTAADGPGDILMRRMIDAFAEYERLVIKARTVSAMQAMKARKERVGAIPYGFKLSADRVHLEEDEGEQLVITEIKRLHEAGLNLSAICREIERQGYYTRTGKPFVSEQIKRIVAV